MTDPLWYLFTFLVAAAVGVAVTDHLMAGRGFWSQTLLGPLKRANFPLGGVLALSAGAFMDHPAAWFALSAAAGMGVTAVGWAWVRR